MKLKFLTLIILSLAIFKLNSMESQLNLDKSPLWQQLPSKLKNRILGHAVWYTLPPELKVHIISYIAQASSVTGVIKNLKPVSLVSKEFHSFAQSLINEFAQIYIQEHQELAEEEFVQAIVQCKLSVFRALMKAGIDINFKDKKNKWTALMWATYYSGAQIIKDLINNSTDIDIPDDRNFTPFIYAVRGQDKAIIKLLIDKGANVNIKPTFGDSPLIDAIRTGDPEIVKLLLDANADPDTVGVWGISAMKEAQRSKNKEIIELLQQAKSKKGS